MIDGIALDDPRDNLKLRQNPIKGKEATRYREVGKMIKLRLHLDDEGTEDKREVILVIHSRVSLRHISPLFLHLFT